MGRIVNPHRSGSELLAPTTALQPKQTQARRDQSRQPRAHNRARHHNDGGVGLTRCPVGYDEKFPRHRVRAGAGVDQVEPGALLPIAVNVSLANGVPVNS